MSESPIKTGTKECLECQHFMHDAWCADCDHNGGESANYTPTKEEPTPETENRLNAENELNYVVDAIHLYAQECASMNGAEFLRTMMLSNINLCRTILTEATINGATKEIVRGVMEAFKAVIV